MGSILIIDDDEGFRQMLRSGLQRQGYQVQEARDGVSAVAAFKAHPADVVVTDIVMPNKDGIETIIELKRLSPDVGIIAVSGGGRVGSEELLNAARSLGADRVLLKPFSLRDLLAAIADHLDPSAQRP